MNVIMIWSLDEFATFFPCKNFIDVVFYTCKGALREIPISEVLSVVPISIPAPCAVRFDSCTRMQILAHGWKFSLLAEFKEQIQKTGFRFERADDILYLRQ